MSILLHCLFFRLSHIVHNCLKGRCHKIFYLRFFSWIVFPWSPDNFISGINIFSTICIRNTRFTRWSQQLCGKFTAGDSDTGSNLHWLLVRVITDLVSNLLADKITSGVSDTSCQQWQTISACLHEIEHFLENQSIGALQWCLDKIRKLSV